MVTAHAKIQQKYWSPVEKVMLVHYYQRNSLIPKVLKPVKQKDT